MKVSRAGRSAVTKAERGEPSIMDSSPIMAPGAQNGENALAARRRHHRDLEQALVDPVAAVAADRPAETRSDRRQAAASGPSRTGSPASRPASRTAHCRGQAAACSWYSSPPVSRRGERHQDTATPAQGNLCCQGKSVGINNATVPGAYPLDQGGRGRNRRGDVHRGRALCRGDSRIRLSRRP